MSLSLLVDLYELTMAQSYFIYKRNACATFDLFVRGLAKNRDYLVFCGLSDCLDYLEGLRFSDRDLAYLEKQRLFSKSFLKYLAGFRFKGDVWAMPEGSIFFANEPVIRVSAPIIEAQIIESLLLNTINLQTMLASKASRVVQAAGGRAVYDFSLRRTHGIDACIKAARASYIAGAAGTSNCLAGKMYNIPVVGTMAHSFIMSFKQELDSFLAYAETFPRKTTLLVDTYNVGKGIENAITTGIYLKEKGFKLQGIRIDSADIASISKLARRMLDASGLSYVKIFASGNLDEFKIKRLLKKGACVDSFGVGTNMGTSADAPSLDVIYKISEVTNDDGEFLPTMKLSKAKVTYPGRKQVFRLKGLKGRYLKDILGLENEKLKGKPLLLKVMGEGKLIRKAPSLEQIRKFAKDELSRFQEALKEPYPRYTYPVVISRQLSRLRSSLSKQLEKRQ